MEDKWICERCGHEANSLYCSNCKLPFPPRLSPPEISDEKLCPHGKGIFEYCNVEGCIRYNYNQKPKVINMPPPHSRESIDLSLNRVKCDHEGCENLATMHARDIWQVVSAEPFMNFQPGEWKHGCDLHPVVSVKHYLP